MKPLLHPSALDQVEALAARPYGAYIFHGSPGVGKYTTALWLLKRVNCATGAACGACAACRQLDGGNFANLVVVQPDGKSVGIAQIQELSKALHLRAYEADHHRAVIIDQAHTLTPEAQNAFLKTLEEPPGGTLIILLAAELTGLLATIRSRCAAVSFAPVPAADIASLLQDRLDSQRAAAVAHMSHGLPGVAVTMSADEAGLAAAEELEASVVGLLGMDLFGRLTKAATLAAAPAGTAAVADILARRTQDDLRKASAGDEAYYAERLEAIERFYVRTAANVTPKSALEALLVEL